jgi:hypothetical protein
MASGGLVAAPSTIPSATTPGLSAGAKAGIGISAAVLVLALAGLLFVFPRRQKAKRALVELQYSQPVLSEYSGRNDTATEYSYSVSEKLPSKQEYTAHPPPAELETRTAKMDGSSGGFSTSRN